MITLRNTTGRKTEARVLDVNGVHLYFSYETLIAVDSPEFHGRVENVWGPTTGRHMKEMEVYDWPEYTQAEIEQQAGKALLYGVKNPRVLRA